MARGRGGRRPCHGYHADPEARNTGRVEVDHAPGRSGFLHTLAEAEAASAAEDWEAATRLWEAIVAINPVEGQFWTRLAEALRQTRRDREAIAAFERAFALRDGYPAETAYEIAVCYARLDEHRLARAWLDRALDLGYRNLARVQADETLAALREDPLLRERLGVFDTAPLSREEGWRADLGLLSREVKRRAFAPFAFVSETRFDAAMAELARAIPDLTDVRIGVEVSRLLCLLGDAHVEVSLPADHPEQRWLLPVQFALFEEGLFIVAAAPIHAALLGAEVIEVGGHPVAEVLAALDALIPRDNGNGQWPLHLIPQGLRDAPLLHALGLAAASREATLTLRDPDGALRQATLTARHEPAEPSRREHFPACPPGWLRLTETLPAPGPAYLRNVQAPYWFAFLPAERTVYLQFNAVRDHPMEPLADFSARVFGFIADHAVDNLVIDIRWNGGGNTFLLGPLLQRIIGSSLNARGRLFVIIGRATFSAAQNFAGLLQRHTAAIFVGEPTGSSPTFVGETIPFTLPYSKLSVNVSDLLWQGTWPMDYRTWIAPTLYARPTFAAFRANRDVALEAIFASTDQVPG